MSKEYEAFLKVYDDIDLEALSDEELKKFHKLCYNGYIAAVEELYKRAL